MNEQNWIKSFKPLMTVGLVVLATVLIVVSATALGESVANRFGDGVSGTASDVEPGIDVTVDIPEGSSAARIGEILAEAGVVRSSTLFEAAVRTAGVEATLRAGSYDLVTQMDMDLVIETLQRGPTVRVFDITVVEGLRVTEILDVLSSATGLLRGEFEIALTSGVIKTGIREMPDNPELSDWEGLLFPDTYRFSQNATAADILARLALTMERRMAAVNWGDLEALGFSQYEGIIIASIIESEVRVAEERPLVSSVIQNRLGSEGFLEIDATVLYALGTRDVAQFDRSFDSPYNTYRYEGLPPTPIAVPGLASLQAAAAPAETEFFFYVLSSTDGSHTFSVTFEEHQAAIAKARADGVLP